MTTLQRSSILSARSAVRKPLWSLPPHIPKHWRFNEILQVTISEVDLEPLHPFDRLDTHKEILIKTAMLVRDELHTIELDHRLTK